MFLETENEMPVKIPRLSDPRFARDAISDVLMAIAGPCESSPLSKADCRLLATGWKACGLQLKKRRSAGWLVLAHVQTNRYYVSRYVC